MSRRKRTFPCGHKGYGKTCHRCIQTDLINRPELSLISDKQTKKQAWEASFEQDMIDLRGLPDYVVVKARRIIEGLIADQRNYRDFGGKRLRHNRLIVSIPVTRNYRLLCEDNGSGVIPQKVLSHEAYNVCKPG